MGGSVILGPLDSRVDNCVWHRVILHAGLPAGCSVTVQTFTAHAELPSSYVLGLDESAWRTRMTAPGSTSDGWDCLLRSDPGRFLWLRLDLAGTGAATPSVSAVEVEYPRISLRRYLPAIYGEDTDSAEFTDRFLGLFDRSLRDVELLVDGLPADLDVGGTPYLDWLASWVGLTLDARLPDAVRRRLLASSPRLYDLRGTLAGLRELLIIVLGLDVRPPCPGCGREPGSCRPAPDCCGQCVEPPPTWEPPPLVLEHFRLRRWLRTGASRIGDDAVAVGGEDRQPQPARRGSAGRRHTAEDAPRIRCAIRSGSTRTSTRCSCPPRQGAPNSSARCWPGCSLSAPPRTPPARSSTSSRGSASACSPRSGWTRSSPACPPRGSWSTSPFSGRGRS